MTHTHTRNIVGNVAKAPIAILTLPTVPFGPLLPPCQTSFRSDAVVQLSRCDCVALRSWRPETMLQGQRSLSTLCRALTLRPAASTLETLGVTSHWGSTDYSAWRLPYTASVKVWSTQSRNYGWRHRTWRATLSWKANKAVACLCLLALLLRQVISELLRCVVQGLWVKKLNFTGLFQVLL